MALDAEKRIPDTTLPANSFKDGDILYGLDMNRVVDTLKTAVNENYKDLRGVVKNGDSIYINPMEGVVDAEGQPIDTVDGLIKWLYDNKILNEGKIYSLRINDSKQFEYYDGESWKLATVGQQGEPGEGVPTGGLSGQFLRKQSDVSYDTEWVDAYDKPQVDSKINNLTRRVATNTNDINRLNKFSIVTLGTTWTQDPTNGYYTQSVALSGITSNDNPIIDIVLSDTLESMQAQQEEWSKIVKVGTSDDGLTFYASEATTAELNLILKMSAVTKSDVSDTEAIQTELTDIRVGYDGTTYDSAGNAVRTQVTTLNNKINDATSELKSDLANSKKAIAELSDKKITKFYASNLGENHITDSDNGKIQDMMIYGKSSQDGTPTPSNPIEIQSVVNPKLEVCGKNLLNPTLQTQTLNGVTCTNNGGTYTLNGTATAQVQLMVMTNITYSLLDKKILGCPSGGSMDSYCLLVSMYDENGKYKLGAYDTGDGVRIYNDYSSYAVSVLIRKSITCNNLVFKPMITTDLNATYDDFEPYQGNQATLPYTLNAIPVSSGGNVTIDGQQYIADYVDIDKKQLVRNILHKIFTSNSSFQKSPGSSNQDDRFYCALTENVKCHIIISNYTDFIDEWGTTSNAIGNGGLGNTTNKFFIRIQDVTSLDELNTKLSNSPLHTLFALATPTIINLTDEEVQAFKSLTTYYPTTNISVNSEQLDGYTIFNYPISMQNGWNYVKQQLNDNRDYIYDMDTQSAEAYVNSEYAVALTELEV